MDLASVYGGCEVLIYRSVLIHNASPMANSSDPIIQSANTSKANSTRYFFRGNFLLARIVAMIAANNAISTNATRKK